jgi:hypothetical protein
MFEPPIRFFEVTPPGAGEWKLPPPQKPQVYEFPHTDDDKRSYGIELAKLNASTLDHRVTASISIFGRDDGNKVMWVAHHWHLDPLVIEARNGYVPPPPVLLDKAALAAKLLECADEKVERNGKHFYINEAKDRLGFLKLYAEVMEFTGKPASTSINNFPSNEMKIVLVKPENQVETKTIELVKKVEEETINITPLRIKVV